MRRVVGNFSRTDEVVIEAIWDVLAKESLSLERLYGALRVSQTPLRLVEAE